MFPDRSVKCHSGALSLLLLLIYLLLLVMPGLCQAASVESTKEDIQFRELDPKMETDAVGNGGTGAATAGNRRSQRSVGGTFGRRIFHIPRSKFPIELGIVVDNEDGDRAKRFDDYGHMRFGKRGGDEQFDDYGHMRFGR